MRESSSLGDADALGQGRERAGRGKRKKQKPGRAGPRAATASLTGLRPRRRAAGLGAVHPGARAPSGPPHWSGPRGGGGGAVVHGGNAARPPPTHPDVAGPSHPTRSSCWTRCQASPGGSRSRGGGRLRVFAGGGEVRPEPALGVEAWLPTWQTPHRFLPTEAPCPQRLPSSQSLKRLSLPPPSVPGPFRWVTQPAARGKSPPLGAWSRGKGIAALPWWWSSRTAL